MKYVTMVAQRVSAIGLGTWQFGEAGWGWGAELDHEEAIRIVHRALELGINFFDTAPVYGNGRSEEIFGEAGDDASLFAIGARTGQISVAQGTALDFETRSSYSVRARANDGRNGQDTITVTIAVTNVEEAGTVGLSSANPEVGVTLTAMLEDPDGGVSDVSWSWERSMNLTTWMAIPGSGSAAYKPTEADEGYHLRATAAYSDDHGPNKRAHMVSATPEPTSCLLHQSLRQRRPLSRRWGRSLRQRRPLSRVQKTTTAGSPFGRSCCWSLESRR